MKKRIIKEIIVIPDETTRTGTLYIMGKEATIKEFFYKSGNCTEAGNYVKRMLAMGNIKK